MATLDPKDPNGRSQVLYRDFYRHHQQSCNAWYIKDENHVFIDASITFLHRFLPSGLSSVTGRTDADIHLSSPAQDLAMMADVERQVMMSGTDMSLFSWDFFCDGKGINAFIIKVKPFERVDGKGVIIYICDVTPADMTSDWFSTVTKTASDAKDETSEHVVNLAPAGLSRLTEREWTVAWMFISGKSLRWIAGHFGIRKSSVDNTLRNIYRKLSVPGKEALLYAAGKYGWHSLIPKKYQPTSALTPLP